MIAGQPPDQFGPNDVHERLVRSEGVPGGAMLKGYTTPRTPKGISSLAPAPPWHYVSTSLAIEFTADPVKVARFLPEELHPEGNGRCAVYFAEWQFATDHGEEYLDPVRSQYKETIFLIAAKYNGEPVAYCPFI